MKFVETKKEKNRKKAAKIERKANKIFDEIVDRVNDDGEAIVELSRTDFKKELSTSYGFGFQGMKKKYKIVAGLVISEGFKFDMVPLMSDGEIGVKFIIK